MKEHLYPNDLVIIGTDGSLIRFSGQPKDVVIYNDRQEAEEDAGDWGTVTRAIDLPEDQKQELLIQINR